MKKILIIPLLLMACLALHAQKFSYVYQGVEFKCKVTGQSVCITSFDVKAQQVIIPAMVSYKGVDYPVKSVSTFLNGVNYLTVSLTLEEGIEEIDKFSFNEFRKLMAVSLPSTIRHIGRNAFRNNAGMAFDMLSCIDDQSIRKGVELWPSGSGERISTNHNVLALAEKQQALNEPKSEEIADEKENETKKSWAGVGAFTGKILKNGKTKSETADASQDKGRKGSPNKDVAKKEQEVVKEILSDVDMNIPVVASNNNSETYCVIIANEEYEDVPKVEFAARDGEIFKEYCIKTLGVPEKQIKTFINASYTDIKRALNWMEQIANVTEGNSRMILYYAGHGMPNEKDKTAYLIPVDGFPKDISTCFKLSELYSRLGKINSQNVTVFLDACFSGVKRGSGQALVAARGIAIKPKEETLSGNVVVFTAASDDETALSYQEKRHGMFTYFLLSKLKETKGQVSFGDLYKAISSGVKKNSMLENDKLQTPSVNVSSSMMMKWENLHF